MKYKVMHTTNYSYTDTVPVCQNIVFLTPRKTRCQTCTRHRITIRPQPTSIHRRTDYFGNVSTAFAIDHGHRRLQITATSTVMLSAPAEGDRSSKLTWEEVSAELPADRSRDGLARYQFAFRSPYIRFSHRIAEYARESFSANRPILDAVRELNSRIYRDFEYDPKATTINTPVEEVFESRRGVCQDLAHLMIGCLRPLGIAARYVSGYLRTIPPPGEERLVGADASHAWVSVYCGGGNWIDLDPTNDVLPSTEHITLAWGRDFGDVSPVSGMFVGGGPHELEVAVDVAPL